MIATPPKSLLSSLLNQPEYTPLSRAAELVFLERVRQGDQKAVNRLVQANMKFVVAVARNYQNQGLSMDDLVQEGAIGLQRAVLKFNISSPNRLISYAVWWIRQAILTALSDQSRTYCLPPRFHDLGAKAERARRRLEQKLGRPPGMDEVAEALGRDAEALQADLGLLRDAESLDGPVGEENTRMDFLPGSEDASARHEAGEQKERIRQLLKALDPTDQIILIRHFGLHSGECETLADIADSLGISRERVRQRQDKALSKLLRPARKMKLFTPSVKLDAKRPEPAAGEGKP